MGISDHLCMQSFSNVIHYHAKPGPVLEVLKYNALRLGLGIKWHA